MKPPSLKMRLRKCEKGTTAIEFAFIAIPFFWLFMGAFEIGAMLLTLYTMDNAVADAARQIRTGQVAHKGITADQFKTMVCDKIYMMKDCAGKLYVDVDRFDDFASVNIPPAVEDDGTLSTSVTNPSFSIGNPMDVVVVRVYYKWKFFTPMIGHFLQSSNMTNERLLTTGAAFRNEPYGS